MPLTDPPDFEQHVPGFVESWNRVHGDGLDVHRILVRFHLLVIDKLGNVQ